jgi:hypothetical protein
MGLGVNVERGLEWMSLELQPFKERNVSILKARQDGQSFLGRKTSLQTGPFFSETPVCRVAPLTRSAGRERWQCPSIE